MDCRFEFGDVVSVKYGAGSTATFRVHGFTSGRRFGVHGVDYYLVKPDRDSEPGVAESSEMRLWDKPHDQIMLDWGSFPSKPTLYLRGDMLVDPFTNLTRFYFKRGGLCPRCGDRGHWLRMSAICPYHGVFL